MALVDTQGEDRQNVGEVDAGPPAKLDDDDVQLVRQLGGKICPRARSGKPGPALCVGSETFGRMKDEWPLAFRARNPRLLPAISGTETSLRWRPQLSPEPHRQDQQRPLPLRSANPVAPHGRSLCCDRDHPGPAGPQDQQKWRKEKTILISTPGSVPDPERHSR